jgi:hypothetical protein
MFYNVEKTDQASKIKAKVFLNISSFKSDKLRYEQNEIFKSLLKL